MGLQELDMTERLTLTFTRTDGYNSKKNFTWLPGNQPAGVHWPEANKGQKTAIFKLRAHAGMQPREASLCKVGREGGKGRGAK